MAGIPWGAIFTVGGKAKFKGDPVTFSSMEKRKVGWFVRLTLKNGNTFALSTKQVEEAIDAGELKVL